MSIVIYCGILIAIMCLVVWLQDRKIKSLGELVDIHDDVLDDLWCDAERMDKDIKTEVSNRKEHTDKIYRSIGEQELTINTLKQDICGLKTGHDMEIIAAGDASYDVYDCFADKVIERISAAVVTKKCKKCGKAYSEKLHGSISPEDRNVLKYKFNIDVPEPKQGTDSVVAASKKRKSK
jgi:hypothetical protein